jgi:hypothetical protein
MNETPCGRCSFYDPLIGSSGKDTGMGWCAKRSAYPAKEGPGQVFPPGVERVTGPLAKPFIVKKGQVLSSCPFVRPTNEDLVAQKKKREEQARTPPRRG